MMTSIMAHVSQTNSSRYRLWLENKRFAESIPEGALVLDAGAGEAPYKALVSHAMYESADFEKVDKVYAKSTYVCDLSDIPVGDGRYDFIFFNQVMEHLPEPALVLKELFRILKPGGKLIYSAPLFYEEHEVPFDFFRYTQYGVRHLFTQAGFIIEKLDWLEGYFGTVAYQMSSMAQYLPSKPRAIETNALRWLLTLPMFGLKLQLALCSILFHTLELRVKYVARDYPKNYVAIVIRPAQH